MAEAAMLNVEAAEALKPGGSVINFADGEFSTMANDETLQPRR